VVTLVRDKNDLIYVHSPSKHFEKTTLSRGRPARSDALIDFCSELQSKCLVPSSEVGKVIQTSEEHLLGIRARDNVSTQTCIRGYITKSISSDVEIAKWLPKQESLYVLVDGASYEDRSFIQ
jgi:hypothetical protein